MASPHNGEDLLDTSLRDPCQSGAPLPSDRQKIAHSSIFTDSALHSVESTPHLGQSDRCISPPIRQNKRASPKPAPLGQQLNLIGRGAENLVAKRESKPVLRDSEDDKKSDHSTGEDELLGQKGHEQLDKTPPLDRVQGQRQIKPKFSNSNTLVVRSSTQNEEGHCIETKLGETTDHTQSLNQVSDSMQSDGKPSDSIAVVMWTDTTSEDSKKHSNETYAEPFIEGRKRSYGKSTFSGKRRRLNENGIYQDLPQRGHSEDYLDGASDEVSRLSGHSDSIHYIREVNQAPSALQSRLEPSNERRRVIWSGTTNKMARKYCVNSNPEPFFHRKRDSNDSSASSKKRQLEGESLNASPWEGEQYADFLFNVCGTSRMLNNFAEDQINLDGASSPFELKPFASN